ncbi:MAG: prolyl-tRNA synthetase [Candidatus Zambryskibacteria bacterium RIFCSPHIGHO2_02_FULL_43_14]|uniref:Proline--tRNA ligase n=1 Tax=Candidatus Zambryskibacteria bacterium RIFCSPHIGHO2_02_FULL_43_14 TaxID=1802748 RepID=A0A1G2TF60_9BACT|nr:MAG: prolyl-tRNA synthetase [Candidatus Zambryskibacteria bacterium RIFCSPHIGHO2_01_FULL_43_60]OHA95927.1 MAG: prolyl-tRNA synthetase [Candidatus Zambryskibacteria bacterium RIFCSPHIGHO2_02_FULL_43_14]OHB03621.1 MAG: prolyl-tRNA synthetase [Candidatus Zambryskibacteria bacterium RIFCSPLOWO2_01_FULL_42_41]
MRQSKLFTKTRKEAPSDEVSKNAILLTRAGFIHKEFAGVYSYLPLGLRVLKKIENIIREEMNAIGGQELLMTALQDSEIWKKTNRWDDKVVDNWFKTKLVNGNELGIANTHEEPITAMLTEFISSYKDLPLYVYQFQTKFRNELRAKSGIMRVREFLMKDLYSFSKTEEEFKEFYEKCANAYMKIFARVGLGDRTYRTVATGGSFTTNLTDEFQTLSEAGEDIIYITDEDKKRAVNKEVEDKSVEGRKSIEVGNIFPYGSKYPDVFGLHFKDEKGERRPIFMGAYGIGLGRLMGTVVEVLSDEKGIVWPKEIAPFQVHLLSLSNKTKKFADEIYQTLITKEVEALYDDRDVRAGEKFADADLIGIPMCVVIGEKAIESNILEVKDRASGKTKEITFEHLINELKS